MSVPSSNGTVFLSYAREDSAVAQRICDALRRAGAIVWFDERDLAGGEAWDREIRRQIRQCALFVALISAHTESRPEGYFRFEWKLAVDRTQLMSDDTPFLVPVVIGDEDTSIARVPEKFLEVQWTHLPADGAPGDLVARITALLSGSAGRPLEPVFVAKVPTPKGGSLPMPASPLVGRLKELAAVQALLTQPETRLLTLSGPGGIGKTRLALTVTRSVSEQFADGVYFVDLSAVCDASLIAASLARVLQLRELPGRDILAALKQALGDRQCLVVIDNLEQLRDGSGILSELLGAAPGLKLLVTSRAPLHLYGEREYAVPPLGTPAESGLTREQCLEAESVKLFVSRASEVRPDFTLTAAGAREVAELCRRLDGLPLAIELVAARVKYLSPHAMLERLQNKLDLLAGGARDRPARQQTMRGAIAWSYDLLPAQQQELFRGLGVFAGQSTLAAASEVLNIAPALLEEELFALADQSLVRISVREENESRFGMLETLREYAVERLVAAGEEERLRERHAAHFLALAESAEPALIGPQQAAVLNRLEDDHDNLRAAHAWFSVRTRIEEKLRLCAALARFWRIRGHLAEGRSRFGDLASLPSIPPVLCAKVLREAGWLIRDQGDYATARTYLETSLVTANATGDRSGAARALLQLGFVARYEGNYTEAQQRYERSLAEARAAADRWCVAASLGNLGLLARDQDDLPQAEALLAESLEAATAIGDTLGIAWALTNLGLVARSRGAFAIARRQLQEALAMWTSLGDRQNIAYCLHNLGLVDAAEGDSTTARQRQEESIRILERVGDRRGIAFVLESLVMLAPPGPAVCIAGAAAALRTELSSAPPPRWRDEYERALRGAREALDPPLRTDAWARGGGLSLRDAINYACQHTTSGQNGDG